jgi:uncharacterized protein YukE
MGLYEGRGQLSKAMKDLSQRWAETKVAWDDAASRAFEERHMVPLEQAVQQAAGAIDHIATVLHQLRRDCE